MPCRTCLDQDDPARRIGAQAERQHACRRTATDDDVVTRLHHRSGVPPGGRRAATGLSAGLSAKHNVDTRQYLLKALRRQFPNTSAEIGAIDCEQLRCVGTESFGRPATLASWSTTRFIASVGMTAQVLGQRVRIQLAAGLLRSLRLALGRTKDGVWEEMAVFIPLV